MFGTALAERCGVGGVCSKTATQARGHRKRNSLQSPSESRGWTSSNWGLQGVCEATEALTSGAEAVRGWMSCACEEASRPHILSPLKKHLSSRRPDWKWGLGWGGVATSVDVRGRTRPENENVPVRKEFHAVATDRGEVKKERGPASSVGPLAVTISTRCAKRRVPKVFHATASPNTLASGRGSPSKTNRRCNKIYKETLTF